MSPGRSRILLPLVLAAVAGAIYSGVPGHALIFNWDDAVYVTANEAARGFSWEHLKLAFSRIYVGNYAPLQIVSYMLDYTLWDGAAAGYFLTNILLHALNGLLFYLLLCRITRQRLAAFVAAFIFVAHPVQVESVAWVSQRKNVLAMLFFLLSFHGYLRYRQRGWREGWAWYAASVAAFILALLTKSVAVVLPAALLLYDGCYLGREQRRGWLADKLPYVLAAAAVALLSISSLSAEFLDGIPGYHGGSPLATFATMLPVFARYLGMLLWPSGLSAIYLPPIRTGFDAQVTLSALLLALLGCLGVSLFLRRREWFFWFAVFFLGLLPVSQIIPLPTLMNDRYLYFPMLGAAALSGLAVTSVSRGAAGGFRQALVALLCIPLLVLPVLSWKRSQVWRDAVTLWSDTVEKTPDSANAWIWLVEAQFRSGRLADVPPAQLRNPGYRQALHDIVEMYIERNLFAQARDLVGELERLYPGHPWAEELNGAGGVRRGGEDGARRARLKADQR